MVGAVVCEDINKWLKLCQGENRPQYRFFIYQGVVSDTIILVMQKKLFIIKEIISLPLGWFLHLSLKRKVLAVVVGIIGISIIVQVITALTKPAPYTIGKAQKSNITEIVTESGNIVAMGKTDVYSPTTGIITEVFVENGTQVKKGDKLFIAKSSATYQEGQAAYANYLSAVATLNAAQSTANTLRAGMYTEWKTFRDLATNSTYEKGDDSPDLENRKAAEFQISQDEWLAAEKKYKDQNTAIAQAQALTASAWNLYQSTQDATVTAPIDGTITNLSITRGSSIGIKSVSLTGSASTPALVITTSGTDEVQLSLSETDITKVEPGQKAKISVNAVSDKIYDGTVSRVDTIGTDNQGVVIYNVYAKFENSDSKIRQGMTVDVDIITSEMRDVLSVPNASIKPYQGGKAVRIPDNSTKEKFKYVPVIVGVRGDEKTQILKGLTDGQEVITTVANENVKRPGLFGN